MWGRFRTRILAVALVASVFAGIFLLGGAPQADAAPGDGNALWKECTDNDCSKVENESALYWRGGRMFLLPGFRGLGLKGQARVRIAEKGSHSGVASVVDTDAELRWYWGRSRISFTLNQSAPWENAMGVEGLTLDEFEIDGSFGIFFSKSASFEIHAQAQLPPLWNDDFSVVVEDPVTLDASWSEQTPILDIQIGEDDADPSLRPLVRTNIPADNTMVAIDSAQFTVAPEGGTLDGTTYDPGLWLDFEGSIDSNPVSLNAQYLSDERRLTGAGSLAKFAVGAVSLENWNFDFDIAPGDVNASISGQVAVVDGPTLDVAGDVYSAADCEICVSLDGTATDFDLASVHVDSLSLDIESRFDDSSTLSAAVDAQMSFMDQPVNVSGSLAAADDTLTKFTIDGDAGPICPKPGVCLTGSSPLGGPQLSGTYDSAASERFAIDFAGILTAEDFELALNGSLNDQGADFMGSLQLEGIVDVTVSGQFYQGPNLAGETVLNEAGDSVPVTAGDWRADAVGSIDTVLSGAKFKGDLDFDAGNVGGSEWVNATGAVNVNNPVKNTNFDASVSGSFSGIGAGPPTYELHAEGSGRFRGFDASGMATITPGAVSIEASTFVPDLQASIMFTGDATFDCVSGPECVSTYNLSGSSDFQLNGINAHGDFTVDSENGIWAVIDAGGTQDNMGFSAHFEASIADGGSLCASANASAWISNAPYVGTLDFGGNVSYCNRDISGALFAELDYTQYTGYIFDVVGYVRAGVDAHGILRMDVNNDGFVVTGSGEGSVFSQQNFEFIWNDPDPDNWCCRINYAPVDLVVANNRIEAWVNVLFWDITLISEPVPYLTGNFNDWA